MGGQQRSFSRFKIHNSDKTTGLHCPYCELLQVYHKVKIPFDHNPVRCDNRLQAIKLMKSIEGEQDNSSDNLKQTFQNKLWSAAVATVKSSLQNSAKNKKSETSETIVDVKKKKAKVREILLREDQHVSPDKASSPMVRGEVNSKSFLIVIDEGAEISVIFLENIESGIPRKQR